MDEFNVADEMANVAEIDLGLPYAMFLRAMAKAGITGDQGKAVNDALTAEIQTFNANQSEYLDKVFDA